MFPHATRAGYIIYRKCNESEIERSSHSDMVAFCAFRVEYMRKERAQKWGKLWNSDLQQFSVTTAFCREEKTLPCSEPGRREALWRRVSAEKAWSGDRSRKAGERASCGTADLSCSCRRWKREWSMFCR